MKFTIKIVWVLLFFTCCRPLICTCQNEMLKGIVRAKNGNAPIAYVNIVFVERQSGTYSDENGRFEIKISKDESISFSAIGYKKATFRYSELNIMGNIVMLEEDVVQLEQVTVTTKRVKEKNWVETFGYYKSKKKSRLIAKTPGFQTATLVVNAEKRSGYVDHVLLNLVSTGKSRIRVHLYLAEKFPQEPTELLKRDLIVDVGRKKGVHKIEVSKYGIIFPPNGLVVGVEFLGNIKADNKVSTENGVEIETKIFLSQADAEQNTWIGFMGRKFEREFYSKIYNTTCNAMVGLAVRFYESEN